MADKSKIEWTDATWNPVTGCSKVSEGCRNCYAERLAPRIGQDFSEIILHHDRLDQPLRWRKPHRIFVNSMSDLFHDDVPTAFLMQVVLTMSRSPQHTYIILTKRTNRMYGFLSNMTKPLPNVYLGVSVENQKTADERIPLLLRTPAAIRFISAEPLLGPLNIQQYLWPQRISSREEHDREHESGLFCDERSLDWVIVGGESGPGARPMHPDWARSIRNQCQSAGAPFFFKQWGEFRERGDFDPKRLMDPMVEEGGKYVFMTRVGKKAAGRTLDGREWSEFPNG